jgi:hypothetical protein
VENWTGSGGVDDPAAASPHQRMLCYMLQFKDSYSAGNLMQKLFATAGGSSAAKSEAAACPVAHEAPF